MTLHQLLIFHLVTLLFGASLGVNNLLAFISATKAGGLRRVSSVVLLLGRYWLCWSHRVWMSCVALRNWCSSP